MHTNTIVFHGIGKIKGHAVKLHIDKSISPVAQPHRHIPFYQRKKVEDELQRLQDLDIIEEVDGPTSWVSPIVVVPKPKNPENIRIYTLQLVFHQLPLLLRVRRITILVYNPTPANVQCVSMGDCKKDVRWSTVK